MSDVDETELKVKKGDSYDMKKLKTKYKKQVIHFAVACVYFTYDRNYWLCLYAV